MQILGWEKEDESCSMGREWDGDWVFKRKRKGM
jgi:hypothetical protein